MVLGGAEGMRSCGAHRSGNHTMRARWLHNQPYLTQPCLLYPVIKVEKVPRGKGSSGYEVQSYKQVA